MFRLTKSWGVTLAFAMLAAALPIVDAPLEEKYGIVITEQELAHFLTLFGVSGGLGAGNALRKNITAKKTSPQGDAGAFPHVGPILPQEDDADEDLLELMPDTPPPPEKQNAS